MLDIVALPSDFLSVVGHGSDLEGEHVTEVEVVDGCERRTDRGVLGRASRTDATVKDRSESHVAQVGDYGWFGADGLGAHFGGIPAAALGECGCS